MINYVETGKKYEKEMPYSEVCIHMRVAGKRMLVELLPTRYPVIQLYTLDNLPFSAPVLPSEAGLYLDADGRYYFHN